MCKHKSGGMNKPSGTNSHEGLSERTPASAISSQDCPHSATIPSATPLSQNNNPYAIMAAAQPPMRPLSNTCDTFNFLPSNDNPPCDSELYQAASYDPPRQFQEDSDEDTEQSPMLLKEAYRNESGAAWNPPEGVLRPESFDPCGAYGVDSQDKSTNCDNFPLYHDIRPLTVLPVSYVPPPFRGAPNYFESTIRNFDERQRMDFGEHGYGAKHKKKWLLNHKCKSADSEPDTSFNRQLMTACRQGLSPVSYNYVQGQGANVLQTHMDGCQSYVKPVYSNNGDPIAGPSGLQRPCSINWELGSNTIDSEFRSRSYSLTPTVNFAVFESESSSEAEDIQEPMVPEPVELPASCEVNAKTIDDPFELPVMPLGKVIPISPSAAQLSIASSYGDNGSPICKICHMTARESDPLISPCRCSGTMQYIHCGCLMRWLEVCHKRGRRPASCELCQYQYHWHKKFKIRHWQLPPCSRKDKVLHLLFVLSVLLMVTCASLTVVFFKQDKGSLTRTDPHQELTQSEVGNLVCGVLFFVAFFVAIYVEAKSHDTLYKLLVKFVHINQQWYIDEYEKKETPPVAV